MSNKTLWAGLCVLSLALTTGSPCFGKKDHRKHHDDKRPQNCCKEDFKNCQSESVHPLDPLTYDEIAAISAFVNMNVEEAAQQYTVYTDIILVEPCKKDVLAYTSGDPFTRKAQVILYNNQTAETTEVIVYVCGTNVSFHSKKRLCGVIPNMNSINPALDNGWVSFDQLVEVIKASPELMQALTDAGYGDDPASLIPDTLYPIFDNTFELFRTNLKKLPCCPEVITKGKPHHRYRSITFSDNNVTDPYAAGFFSIVNGVEAVWDSTDNKICAVITTNPTRVKAPGPQELAPEYFHKGTHNKVLTSIENDANNFSVNGHEVTWDNWKFRLSWHPHNGIELYQIQYWDQKQEAGRPIGDGEYRSILYKASLTDAIVSYNTGNDVLFARNYLSGDTFHYPWLRRFVPLCKGRDVPDYAELFDFCLANTAGNPETFQGVIGIYEQDGDLLWRTATPISDAQEFRCVEGARGRQLVVRSIFQGTYYLWIVSWIFNQDGSMNVGIDVGGRTQNIIIPEDSELEGGELIAPQEFSLNHTHTYAFRLDFDVDGTNNTLIEENQATVNNRKKNQCGQFVDVSETVLKREKDAIRDLNPKSNRQWIVINEDRTNRLGHHVGYELVPGKNGYSKSADYSTLHKQFSFIKHHLHATLYEDNQQFASGEMPILQDKDTGLGAYVKDNRNIENKDLVLWYTINFAHVPHSEDYPHIALYRQGFSIVPHNFFESNPGITVPFEPKTCFETDICKE